MKENEEPWCMTTEMTPKISKGKAPSLRSRDYKDPPCVLAIVTSGVQMDWNEDDVMYTLRARDYKEPPAVAYVGS